MFQAQLLPAVQGDALAVDAHEIPGTALNRMMSAAVQRRTLTVTVRFRGAGNDRLRQFEMTCLRLRELSLGGARTGLAVSAAHVPPQAAWELRRRYLGTGPLAMFVDDGTGDDEWLQLWRLRSEPLVTTVVPAGVRSPCSLLSPEKAEAVLPRLSMCVPPASAWVSMRIDLQRFARAGGTLRYGALDRALESCVETGDRLHDLTEWQCGAMRHDAWFNRRLAIDLVGLGELVHRWQLDPCGLSVLEQLRGVVGHVRATLEKRSLQLAESRGTLPCIEQTDPSRSLPAGGEVNDWHTRWKQAVAHMSFRHRTLLTMSPWSLLSKQGNADIRQLNLLPLIADSDAVAFRRPVSIAHWNINEFKEFHRRTAAILQKKHTAPIFAERV